jgi:hypothetical protein
MAQRAINSVLAQTKQPRALIVEIDKLGRGAPATRSAGLAKVRTEWVAFLDSDDVLLPQHLATLHQGAVEHSADYVYSWFECRRYQGDRPAGTWNEPFHHFGKPFDPARPVQTTITILVRTELAQELSFPSPPGSRRKTPDGGAYGEDYWFTVRAARAGAKIVHIPQRTWHWVLHGGNTSGRPTNGDAR